MFARRRVIGVLAVLAVAAGTASGQQGRPPADPLVKENATVKVSDHVWVIPDFNVGAVPNVGIIVGSKATLVVDTGLGPRNGQTVLREVAKVSQNRDLFVMSTHFHPEHALGEAAFPQIAKVIRARALQQDIDEFGLASARGFASRSAVQAELLKDVDYRKADIFFDKDYTLDLGGVQARLMWVGPTHTRGDTIIWIAGADRILFAGDVVMNHRFVSFSSPYSSVKAWLNDFDQLEPFKPARIVPSHGPMGDASLITEQREIMKAIQARAVELKRQGKTADETGPLVQMEMQAKFPDFGGAPQAGNAAKVAWTEAQ